VKDVKKKNQGQPSDFTAVQVHQHISRQPLLSMTLRSGRF